MIVEDGHASGGCLAEKPEFLRFSVHWGFRIRACRPCRAQTKGKVERPVSYIPGVGKTHLAISDHGSRERAQDLSKTIHPLGSRINPDTDSGEAAS